MPSISGYAYPCNARYTDSYSSFWVRAGCVTETRQYFERKWGLSKCSIGSLAILGQRTLNVSAYALRRII